MIGIYNTIQLNGVELFPSQRLFPKAGGHLRGGDHHVQREGHRRPGGVRYADMTLNWDTLPQAQLDVLLAVTGQATLVFTDADGVPHTEQVIPTSRVWVATRFTGLDGNPCWKDVSMGVRFVNAHH